MGTKPAYWIRNTHVFRRDEYVCSACGYRAAGPGRSCPRCGVRMKGAKNGASWIDEMAAFDAMFDD